jgi:hypothetical protein
LEVPRRYLQVGAHDVDTETAEPAKDSWPRSRPQAARMAQARRVVLGAPNDPQFYGDLEIDAGTLMDHLHQLREQTGTHVTVTHAVGRAVAHGPDCVPDLRVRLARGREYARESTAVFFIVAADGGELTGCKVDRANDKSLVEMAQELEASRTSISGGSDESFARMGKASQDPWGPWEAWWLALRRAEGPCLPRRGGWRTPRPDGRARGRVRQGGAGSPRRQRR